MRGTLSMSMRGHAMPPHQFFVKLAASGILEPASIKFLTRHKNEGG